MGPTRSQSRARGNRSRAAAVLAMAAVGAVSSAARGVDRYWVNAGNGNWNTAGNWNTIEGGGGSIGVPIAGDSVFIRGSTSKTVTMNSNYTVATAIGPLQIDSTSASATLTLSQSINSLYATNEFIGITGNGRYN